MSKTFKHRVTKIRNSQTGEFEFMPTLKGESAYEAAVRLGTFTGTEEEYNNQIATQRDNALSSLATEGNTQVARVQAKGLETLSSIPETYTDLQAKVNNNSLNIETLMNTAKDNHLENFITNYYAIRRTGKVYQTKLYKFATNPSSTGEKLLDNAGLICEPSTDTIEGQDDYADIPLFQWVNVNYIRDEYGAPHPIAIEGMHNYKTEGSVDVGVMQMSFYAKWDTSNDEYDLVTISDSPHPELGLEIWSECKDGNGGELSWCIGSKYFSGIASDGLHRSQPNLAPAYNYSYNAMVSTYQKKGTGYWGAGIERNTFQIIFNAIKYATKNSQKIYTGMSNFNVQYVASIQSDEVHTYFPLTNANANQFNIGDCVSVGYKQGTSTDRGTTNMNIYANRVRVLKKEAIDESNTAIYLDITEGFSTTPVVVSDTVTSEVYISSMPAFSGTTDYVINHHDGSRYSNTNSHNPYRVQGREYMNGQWIVSSDTIMDFQSNYSRNVYVAPRGIAHSTNVTTIKDTYSLVGNIPPFATGSNPDVWIGDIAVDISTGAWYPSAKGSSDSQGCGDYIWAGGNNTLDQREYLMGGFLRYGSADGSCSLACWNGLSSAAWSYGGAD